MRDSARRALADAPSVDDLDLLASTLRGHMHVLIPEVEQLAVRRHDTAGISARACVDEARRKLNLGNGDIEAVRVSVVQKLARSVDALCRHYVALGGADA
ncbi:DUF6415 family natural product biosynthesis protein [Streptomyces spinosisporus]|uniref:DUF6415 family natural product biosynthesis protein n=1 Tax=Streptomyces spinosisporus TaxID=2927582 RepID=A0ABS9XW14_9ACTN|nr:DUF6415 family natural product biosynthesis protein [Streptomyces spinosisporus]MCI3246274.1 DUF6415 family natural product biosynthesis protein [Streptomyces spinosisporus]